MYINVSTFKKTFDDSGLIYFVPDFLENKIKEGQIVNVTIGDKIEIALVMGIVKKEDLKIEKDKIRSIISIKDETIFLKEIHIRLIKYISKNYFSSIHNATNLFFPKNLKEKIIKEKTDFIKKKESEKEYEFNLKKTLSRKQLKILDEIQKQKNKKFLLYGITGSGKTEIYIKLIEEQLKIKKQSLLLIPEIILTNQLEIRLKEVFGESITIINSNITEANKTKAWRSIYSGNSKIIIGTRSSMFYPYKKLGLIIIDEEHDNSYISENSPKYNTIEVAEKFTEINGNKLVLASGTPSINSMYKSIKNKYKLLNLLEKYKKIDT